MPSTHPSRTSLWLKGSPAVTRHTFAIVAAFCAYFCMYAFRKPFSAATYGDASFLDPSTDLKFKKVIVISQLLGYALSKFLGVRLLSGMGQEHRSRALVGLVGGSWAALLVFAVTGHVAQAIALFLNGLCLGMIWGLVVSYLEGRRASELLLAGLSCSFIVASGVVKDIGRWLLSSGVPEPWMPFLVGALFFPPYLLTVWMLAQVPAPTTIDEDERSKRSPMNSEQRQHFIRNFAVPLGLLLASYFLLTAFRDYRDNYAAELFLELGYKDEPALFSSAEIPVAFGVLAAMALLSRIRDNRRALQCVYAVMILGLLMLSLSTMLLTSGAISGLTWMILTGLGLYLTYVPFGSVLFDRIIAHTRVAGTAVFGIYLADAVGYSGSIAVMLYSDLFAATQSPLEFFQSLSHLMAWLGAALLAGSAFYWFAKVPYSKGRD